MDLQIDPLAARAGEPTVSVSVRLRLVRCFDLDHLVSGSCRSTPRTLHDLVVVVLRAASPIGCSAFRDRLCGCGARCHGAGSLQPASNWPRDQLSGNVFSVQNRHDERCRRETRRPSRPGDHDRGQNSHDWILGDELVRTPVGHQRQ